MNVNDEIRKYCEARDEAVKSMDLETFKAFVKKYKVLPIQYVDDRVIEITMRKMAVHITSLDIDTRVKAFRWLLENGYDFSIGADEEDFG